MSSEEAGKGTGPLAGIAGKHLTFALSDEEYGVSVLKVREIIKMMEVTLVPRMPPHVKGVINLRGKVIPVMDVRVRFSFEEKPYDDHTCIIVVNINDASVGLIVDTVSEVIGISEDKIDPPPAVKKGDSSRFIKGLGKVGETVVILLDIGQLLYDNLMDQMAVV